jgi:hypothetical protein
MGYQVSGFGRPLLHSIVYCKTFIVLIPERSAAAVHCPLRIAARSIVYCLNTQYQIPTPPPPAGKITGGAPNSERECVTCNDGKLCGIGSEVSSFYF